MSWKREKGRRVALAAWSSKNGSHFVWWQPSLAQQRLLPLTMHCCIHWAAKWLFQAGTQPPLLGTLVPHHHFSSSIVSSSPLQSFFHSLSHFLNISLLLCRFASCGATYCTMTVDTGRIWRSWFTTINSDRAAWRRKRQCPGPPVIHFRQCRPPAVISIALMAPAAAQQSSSP